MGCRGQRGRSRHQPRALEKEVINKFVPRVIQRIAAKASAEVVEKWAARVIPLASSAIGAGLNYWFVKAWGQRAKLHFRERHLVLRQRAQQETWDAPGQMHTSGHQDLLVPSFGSAYLHRFFVTVIKYQKMPTFSCSAILFDLDGVLVDSTRAVDREWREWARRKGVDGDAIMAIAHGVRTHRGDPAGGAASGC